MKNQGEPGRTQLKYKLVNQFKSTSYKEYIKTLRKTNPFNLCIFYIWILDYGKNQLFRIFEFKKWMSQWDEDDAIL